MLLDIMITSSASHSFSRITVLVTTSTYDLWVTLLAKERPFENKDLACYFDKVSKTICTVYTICENTSSLDMSLVKC